MRLEAKQRLLADKPRIYRIGKDSVKGVTKMTKDSDGFSWRVPGFVIPSRASRVRPGALGSTGDMMLTLDGENVWSFYRTGKSLKTGQATFEYVTQPDNERIIVLSDGRAFVD